MSFWDPDLMQQWAEQDRLRSRKVVEAYGYCPTCGETHGVSRERSPHGRTECSKCGWSLSAMWKPL